MARHDQRRAFVRGTCVVVVARRKVEGMRDAAIGARIGEALGRGQVARVGQLGRAACEHRVLCARHVDSNDLLGLRR